jgi:chromosome segregation ATPase
MITNNQKIFTITAALVVAVAIIIAGISFSNFKKTKRSLNENKLSYERLLAEKLELDKKTLKMQDQLFALGKDNELALTSLTGAEEKIKDLENQLKVVENNNKKVKSLESQISDLQKKNQNIANELAESNLKNEQLKNKNDELNQSLAMLQEEFTKLRENNRILSTMIANNYRVESVKGKKDKLTLNAKKTKKVLMSFDIPQDIATNIHLKIQTPEGKIISGTDKNITWRIVEIKENYLASALPYLGDIEIKKRIEITYKPVEKLNKGIYSLEFYNSNTLIGMCQIRLK